MMAMTLVTASKSRLIQFEVSTARRLVSQRCSDEMLAVVEGGRDEPCGADVVEDTQQLAGSLCRDRQLPTRSACRAFKSS